VPPITAERLLFEFGTEWIAAKKRYFLSRTVRRKQCLIWQGAKSGLMDGYGVFGISPLSRTFYIHRAILSWKLGKQLEENALHTCDNSLCINEDHLYEGTTAQNLLDSYVRGGRNQSRKGSVNGRCNTSQETVLEVRKLWETGNFRKIDIARKLHITDMKVHRILESTYWM
jgi:hypothetical protein